MRKLLLALGCMLFMTGLVIAADYTVVKFDKDKKVVTLKDQDGKEVEAKLTDKTKVTTIDKEGAKKEGTVAGAEKFLGNEKTVGRKVEATVKSGEITEISYKAGGGKKESK